VDWNLKKRKNEWLPERLNERVNVGGMILLFCSEQSEHIYLHSYLLAVLSTVSAIRRDAGW
jgi:hypothetical protein